MKIGNETALPSVCRDHLTNMPRTIVTTTYADRSY